MLENLEKTTPLGETLDFRFYDKYGNETERPNYDAALPEGVNAASVIATTILKRLAEEQKQKVFAQNAN